MNSTYRYFAKTAGRFLLPAVLLLLLLGTTAEAQQGKRMSHADSMAFKASIKTIYILSAKRLHSQQLPDSSILQSFVGKVRMRQDRTYFSADSVALNTRTNIVEAFGHVNIDDAGKMKVSSDYLRYTGEDKKAYLKGNVVMRDATGVLRTPELNYDMATRTGIYTQGGHLVNGHTVLNSRGGIYYGQTHDAQFTGQVKLNDPGYNIHTDTLLYNTESKIANFTVPTVIDKGKNHKIITSDGWYNLKNETAYFGKRPTIIDSTSTLIADEVARDGDFGEARGNAILKDTAQGTLVIGDNIKTNRKDGSFMATIHPIAVIKQGDDSLFIAADTLYSARLSDRMKNDSIRMRLNSFYLSSEKGKDSTGMPRIVHEELPPAVVHQPKDSLAAPGVTVEENISKISSRPQPADSAGRLPLTDSLVPPPMATVAAAGDSLAPKPETASPSVMPPTANRRSTARNNRVRRNSSQRQGRNENKTGQEDENKDRYMEAYNHVRIYSDSLQAVGDSLFYSFKDSLFRLFKNPIVWTQENQLAGDTIYLYTEQKKPKRLFVFENAVAINRVDSVPSHNFYNQVRGRTINAMFTNGQIDSLRAKGSAESIYYVLDEHNKYIGVNKSSSDIIDMYFLERKPQKVLFRSDVHGTLYPIQKADPAEMQVRGFQLYEQRRPKSKYELLEPPVEPIEPKKQPSV